MTPDKLRELRRLVARGEHYEYCGHKLPSLDEHCDCWMSKALDLIDAELAQPDEMATTIERQTVALGKINAIRNSIVGFQKVNFSEHVYPLVAALDECGIKGEGYEAARDKGRTLLQRIDAADAEARRPRRRPEDGRQREGWGGVTRGASGSVPGFFGGYRGLHAQHSQVLSERLCAPEQCPDATGTLTKAGRRDGARGGMMSDPIMELVDRWADLCAAPVLSDGTKRWEYTAIEQAVAEQRARADRASTLHAEVIAAGIRLGEQEQRIADLEAEKRAYLAAGMQIILSSIQDERTTSAMQVFEGQPGALESWMGKEE